MIEISDEQVYEMLKNNMDDTKEALGISRRNEQTLCEINEHLQVLNSRVEKNEDKIEIVKNNEQTIEDLCEFREDIQQLPETIKNYILIWLFVPTIIILVSLIMSYGIEEVASAVLSFKEVFGF